MIRRFSKRVTNAAMVAGLALAATGATYALQDEWSYSGNMGPEDWDRISPACAGAMQSPIVIEGTEPAILHRLDLGYQVNAIDLHNEHHTVRQHYAPGSVVTVGGKAFILKEFHFHTPAEHRILDRSFPLSIHFTNVSLTGEVAIISVLVTEGKSNLAAEELLPHLPLEPGQSTNRPDVKINARDFMPSNMAYYRYMGSLTTPPCSEGVNWYVLKTPVEFSAEQIAAVRNVIGTNARPVQPRNNRIILDALPQ